MVAGGPAYLRHNRLGKQIARMIVRDSLAEGGGPSHALVLLQSIIVGVLYACVKPEGRDTVLDTVVAGAKERLRQETSMEAS